MQDQKIRPLKEGMSQDLREFLFEELNEHLERLFDLSVAEEPNVDEAEYHHNKAVTIVKKIKDHT